MLDAVVCFSNPLALPIPTAPFLVGNQNQESRTYDFVTENAGGPCSVLSFASMLVFIPATNAEVFVSPLPTARIFPVCQSSS